MHSKRSRTQFIIIVSLALSCTSTVLGGTLSLFENQGQANAKAVSRPTALQA